MSKIRKSAAGKFCTLRLLGCHMNSETVVLAHIRTPGTGIGRKPLDSMGLYACSKCHDVIDGRRTVEMMEKEIQERIIAGLAETHEQIIVEGHMVLR